MSGHARAEQELVEPLLKRSLNQGVVESDGRPLQLKHATGGQLQEPAQAPSSPPVGQQTGPRFSGMTPGILVLFLLLGIIRGTSTVMLKMAGKDIDPSLVVVLRSPPCILLFIATIAAWAHSSESYNKRLRQTAAEKSTWAKLALMGLVQSAAPFLLFSYGLERLPASLGGAFMSVTPLCAVVIQRTCCYRCITAKTPVNGARLAGMIVSVVGVVLLALPQLIPICSYSCQPLHSLVNTSVEREGGEFGNELDMVNESNASQHCNSTERWMRTCSTLEHKSHNVTDVALGLVLLFAGTFSWGFSAVFWRQYKGSIHFTLAGFGQILFGGIFSAIFWMAISGGNPSGTKMHWNQSAIWCVVYLAVLSGWVANFILYYLYQKIGPVAATRVLCLVPAVSWIEQHIISNQWPHLARDLGMDIGGLVLIFLGLQMFEGRIDAICGVQIPCIAKRRFTKQVQVYEPMEGLADHREFAIDWPERSLVVNDGEKVEVYEGELGNYALL